MPLINKKNIHRAKVQENTIQYEEIQRSLGDYAKEIERIKTRIRQGLRLS